jgi:hypothetical protein
MDEQLKSCPGSIETEREIFAELLPLEPGGIDGLE